MTDFASLIRLLSKHNVEFIIVGCNAATAHGSARPTQDLDIVYRQHAEQYEPTCGVPGSSPTLSSRCSTELPFRLDVKTIRSG
jgi:hypothetical protein